MWRMREFGNSSLGAPLGLTCVRCGGAPGGAQVSFRNCFCYGNGFFPAEPGGIGIPVHRGNIPLFFLLSSGQEQNQPQSLKGGNPCKASFAVMGISGWIFGIGKGFDVAQNS